MVDPSHSRMFAEAGEASKVVARQLALNRDVMASAGQMLRDRAPHTVLTCARGSSDHAATYLKHLVETRVGVMVASLSPSIASIYRSSPMARGMLAIGLSQSGKSPDLLAAMAAVSASGAGTLALVNAADSPLADAVDVVVPLQAGRETSVAATKSFIALLTASVSLVAEWADDDALRDALAGLPELLAEAWECDWAALVGELADTRGLYVIGRGPSLGIAQEAALKLKETCGLHAEAFSAAEVRHGPLALVGPDLPLLVFRQADGSADGTDRLIEDALAQGARVVVASDRPSAAGTTWLKVPATDPVLASILAVQAFYRAASALSVRRGFDPDQPPYLHKVTETV
ncbi:SIS domain-containing protein [Sphingomonas aerophila]|uniref:Glucosamine--fructose-6-phosphate aminotransferase (Isomerizing) n=1 Tax=Sphingomonas aerophila TaxID=1344948 RepID=A0A7W9BCC8_9SPHN|nr:SIS domain-containing protein [Sphingomonas aerophila]MBB5714572.1 glucosamine--fructose-6-phosphate aminotransferase (isomerizing) [Sphingomonas aerophila]